MVEISKLIVIEGSLSVPETGGFISSNQDTKGTAVRPEVPVVKIVTCETSNCFESDFGKLLLVSRIVPPGIS